MCILISCLLMKPTDMDFHNMDTDEQGLNLVSNLRLLILIKLSSCEFSVLLDQQHFLGQDSTLWPFTCPCASIKFCLSDL